MGYIMKGSKYIRGGGVEEGQCGKANCMSYIKVHVNYLKKNSHLFTVKPC